ncbi:2-oxoglutarate and iron-dependent oxygenase domain-containing protein 3 [Galemys pyrenaicus]|uniref:2-oxoglutarate and iron-dependent oxygenase domain-containing protein 3 n=1 Tax=Galemys pyrenaicus TaxID=202257 RepID=A0A8J5ZU80_GALPY|nr:2-oxoglutarate and iron-dependent oxygenase domain-containing protein 3 [Galemys pyrenaicus]
MVLGARPAPGSRSAVDCSGLAAARVERRARRPRARVPPASLFLPRLGPGLGGSRVRPRSAAAGPMAPQRRGAPKALEGSGGADRRRPTSAGSFLLSGKSGRAPREARRKWVRAGVLGACAALAGLLLWGSQGADDDGVTEVLAGRGEILAGRFIEVPCSDDYDGHRRFEGCSPRRCGRGVSDAVITQEEARRMRSIAEKGLALGGSDGGASILDLHSGALSVGKHFVNLYRYFGEKVQNVFSEEDFQLYREVRRKVQHAIAQAFGISAAALHLTKPTFFSRINSTAARTAHDEYWHAHVDKVVTPGRPRPAADRRALTSGASLPPVPSERGHACWATCRGSGGRPRLASTARGPVTYGSFDYTSLLYLSDYLHDFGGGRFVFLEDGANRTVEPRAGRVSFFTSGSENLHRVEKVRWGTRYAITIAFTCNPDHAIADPAVT